VFKKIKWKDLPKIFLTTVWTTAKVTIILACALVAAWIITAVKLSDEIVRSFGFLIDKPVLLVVICQLIFLLLGMVMDLGSIVMIMVPVLMPLVKAAGIDLVYFGILMIINLTFGMITPPVGAVLYIGMGISKAGIAETMKGAWPFMAVEIVLIILFAVVPEIITVPLSWLL